MVLFTVKKVRVWDVIHKVVGMPALKFGIHPTILATVALAELAEQLADTLSQEAAHDFGVDSIMTLHRARA